MFLESKDLFRMLPKTDITSLTHQICEFACSLRSFVILYLPNEPTKVKSDLIAKSGWAAFHFHRITLIHSREEFEKRALFCLRHLRECRSILKKVQNHRGREKATALDSILRQSTWLIEEIESLIGLSHAERKIQPPALKKPCWFSRRIGRGAPSSSNLSLKAAEPLPQEEICQR